MMMRWFVNTGMNELAAGSELTKVAKPALGECDRAFVLRAALCRVKRTGAVQRCFALFDV